MIRALLLALGLTLAATPIGADPRPLQLLITQRVAFAPADIFVKLRVNADPEQDRWISVQIISDGFSRSSEWSIEGDRRLYSYWVKGVPAGNYTIVAAMGREQTARVVDKAEVIVRGFE